MPPLPLDQLPGFRRRFRVATGAGWVRSAVEDDYHCMRVTVHHDGERATDVQGEMLRVPWTTCPGATAQLRQTFTGVALRDFPARGDKPANCTHLHDLALLAAAHAFDTQPPFYDILVSDPVDGRRHAEIRRDGQPVLSWTESDYRIVEPAGIAGTRLDQLRNWIDSLAPDRQEAARLLRWGNILANGRQIPLEKQSDATRMPPNCYTFQPERKTSARRVGAIRDFSSNTIRPLDSVAL
ncbi:DUF2889 domain-containing protein [Solimonas terrae]|uniref:DUF2889 domain-containing protein n=1 Tax=Solimonas terrae TaxID=1396819 RepID=A0A6M2BNJ4_9GAMM|nr:DUF2889 domain-containing protein [Solimonas terrae]NGY03944.1 DUF2889 domain-containing protein [Solimonas terrae]